MKKLEKAPPIKDGHRKQRFVFKKINKQLISIVGTTLLLVGNYAIGPIQVLANETSTSTPPVSAEQALPTIASSDPAAPESGTEQTQEETTAAPAAEAANEEQAPQNQAAPESNTTDTTESTEETITKITDESREADSESPKQKSTTAEAGDWQAQESDGYMVIQSYSGDVTNITVPSTINERPVEINLKAVLGNALRNNTRTFTIEKSEDGKPVKLTGSFQDLFYRNSSLETAVFNDADTSAIINMSNMFNDCEKLTNLDISDWDTGNVTNMRSMFYSCMRLTELDISSWNVGNVSSLYQMFYDCRSLTELNISGWKTGSVANMNGMFYSCTSLTELNISGWNTSSVTNMTSMFYNCVGLTELNLSNWNTENVTAMSGMFSNCLNLTTLDLSSWVTRTETNTDGMFSYSTKLNTLTCSKAFVMSGNQGLPDLPKSTNNGKTTYYWSEIGDMDKAYASTTNLITAHNGRDDADPHTYKIDKKHTITFNTDGGSDTPATVAVWDGEKLAEPDYQGTKGNATFIGWADTNGTIYDFDQVVTSPFELKAKWEDLEWITEDAGDYTRIIGYNGDPETIAVPSVLEGKPVVIDLSNVTKLSGYLKSQTKTFAIEKARDGSEPVRLTGSFRHLFESNSVLESVDFANADTSAIKDMEAMFQGCSNLTELDLSGWNTENVTNMKLLFAVCDKLTAVDLSGWSTENVTDMEGLFFQCPNLTTVDLSGWSTENVTHMEGLFLECPNLTILTCSKAFEMTDSQHLRDLPEKENNEKTTYYWVVDGDKKKTYPSTNALIEGHNELSDTDAHTYTIEKNHAVTFDTDGGSDAPSDTVVWDGEKLADPDYQGTKNNSIFKGWTFEDQPYDFDKSVGAPLKLKASWEESVWITQEAGEYTRIIGYKGEAENVTVPAMLYDKPVEIDLGNVENLSGYLRTETETFKIEKAKESSKPVKLTGSFSDLFRENSALTSADFADADTSTIEDMSYMFNGCSSLTTLHASGWNTENVITMLGIFLSCSKLSNLDLSGWKTENVINMEYLFTDCSGLTTLDLSGWTTANVSKMGDMFDGCSNLATLTCSKAFKLDVSQWLRDLPNEENDEKTIYYWVVDGDKEKTYKSTSDLMDGHNGLQDNDPHTYTIEKKHTVTFDTDGGSNAPKAVEVWPGEKVSSPDYQGSKDYAVFKEWVDKDGKPYDFNQPVNEPLDLKASWEDSIWNTVKSGEYTRIIGYRGDKESITIPSMLNGRPVEVDLRNVENLSEYLRTETKTFKIEEAKEDSKPVKLRGSLHRLFYYNSSLVSVDFSDADTSAISVMMEMFQGCSNLTTPDVSEWNTENVTNMLHMFNGCSSLTTLDVSDWNTENVTIMQGMFKGCSSLTTLDVSEWNTENVTDMDSMFEGCSSLTTVDVSDWNTENVTDMIYMFYGCINLTDLDVSGWNTGKVTDMGAMFLDCSSLTTLNVSCWNTENVMNMSDMFTGCLNLTTLDVSDWNTENVIVVAGMFSNCSKLTTLDVSGWTMKKVTEMQGMFYECRSLDSLDVSGWNTENVTDMSYMFSGCSNLTTLNVSGWNTGNVTDMQRMFYDCSSLTTLDVSDWNTENVTSMGDTFNGCINLATLDVSDWNTENVIIVSGMFSNCSKLTTLDLSDWTMKKVKQMQGMFYECSSLTNLNASGWTTENVYNMFSMFSGCSALTTLDVSSWNTENVADMRAMFSGCSNLTTLTCSKKFKMNSDQTLRALPEKENEDSTIYYWVVDDNKDKTYGSTDTLIAGHNALSDNDPHTYTIEKNHVVTFDTNEGSDTPDTVKVWDNDYLTDPDYQGTKAHHQFVGWFVGDKAFEFNETKITSPVTLTAKWRLNEYAVQFNKNNGTGTMEKQTFQYDEQKVLSANTFSRTGYTFTGWNTQANGEGESYTDKQEVKNLSEEDGVTIDLYAQWKLNTYTVTFDSQGGSTVPAQSYTIEKGIDKLPTPTKKGYTFQGWYDGEKKVESIATGEIGNRSLTAKWKLDTYTISFDSKGGKEVKDKEYTVETDTFELPELARTGYTFEGWFDAEDNRFTKIEKGTVGNKDLTAKWEAVKYTVTFDSQGGLAVPAQSYTIEKGIPELPTPIKKGYTFQGWYDGEKKVESIETGEMGDRSLTAKWKLDTYTITFDSKGGKEVDDKEYTVLTDTFELPELDRTGYTFQGWADKEGNVFREIEKGTAGDKHLTAQWEAVKYTVTFDSQGGLAVPAQSYTIEKGIDKLPTPIKKGYAFQGWYDGGDKVESIETGEMGDRKLTAQWEIITYTITFDDVTIPPINYTVESETISLPKKTRLGYTFLGWQVSEETVFRALAAPQTIVQEIKTGTTGNLRLSAHWQANQYTITFEPNGGKGEQPAQTLTYDTAAKLAANKFTREGYIFTGWNTQADGKGTTFTDQQEVKNLFTEPNSTLTLFAQWTPNKTALEELITKEGEKPRDNTDYTEESWKLYEDALAKAKQILENPNATSEEIRSALAALQAAINNLKPIKSGATGIPTSTNNSTTSANRSATSTGKVYPSAISTKSYPRTGMLAGSGLMIVGIAAVGAAVAGWQKRKGK